MASRVRKLHDFGQAPWLDFVDVLLELVVEPPPWPVEELCEVVVMVPPAPPWPVVDEVVGAPPWPMVDEVVGAPP